MNPHLVALPMAVLTGCLSVGASEVMTGSQRVLFDDAEHGFAVTGIVNRIDGVTRFVRGSSKAVEGSFWAVEFRRACPTGGHVSVWVSNMDACSERQAESSDSGCHFAWKGVLLPGESSADVHVDVLPNGSGDVEWRIAVNPRSREWVQGIVRFPILAGIAADGAADVMMPSDQWLGAKVYPKFDYRRDFSGRKNFAYTKASPAGWGPMMAAYMMGGKGLSIAALDPSMSNKSIWLVGDSFYFESPVENAGVPGLAASGPRFAVTTSCYRGDWWQAAKIYRKWALRQKWTAKGPIAFRKDYPHAIVDADLWLRVLETDYSVLDNALRLWPDVKPAVRHYRWNVESFDTHYPEFQLRPGVETFWKSAARKGIVVIPYTNGRLWDMGMRSFRYAKRDVCMKENGEPFTELYASKCGVMCPCAKDWHLTLMDMGTALVERNGVIGTYYDQVGCSPWVGCRNPAHGHPLEGGSWWTDGYRQAFEDIHARFSRRGVPVTTEGPGEMFMDVIDGALIVGTNRSSEDVPFMPAVYSGYTTFYCIEQDPSDSPEAFFARQIQGVMLGCATGSWGQKELLSPNPKERVLSAQANIIHRAARLRKEARAYLGYGFLNDEIRLLDPVESLYFPHKATRRWSPTGSKYPAIVGTVWTDAARKRGATFAANVSGESRRIRFRIQGCEPEVRKIPGEKIPQCVVHEDIVEMVLDSQQIAFVEYKLLD